MNENTMKNCKEYEDISATVEELKNSIKELANSIREFGDYIKELMNDTDSYTDLALKTLNKDVFEQKDLILNASLGLSGEVGEVNDIIKKYMYHGHKLDDDTKEKIILELGDVCWYVALMAWAIDKTKFEDVLNKNIAKLEKRYHGEFSTEKSINRKEDSDNGCKEKKEEEVKAIVDNLVFDALEEAQEKLRNKATEKEGEMIVHNLLVDAINEYYIAYYKKCFIRRVIDKLSE